MTPHDLRPDLLLGVAEIDRQHRDLLACAGRLQAVITDEQASGQIRSLLAALIVNAEAHFASEEAIMLAQGYGGHAAHRAEHEKLLELLHAVDADLGTGAIESGHMLALFVEAWTERHITGPDRQLAEFLKAKGRA